MENGISTNVVMMTVDQAAEILETNTYNRGIRPRHVQKLAGAMRRGEWLLNGEPIIISNEGRLVDGQHRLHAVLAAGIEVPMLIVGGVTGDVIHTIDTGSARSAGDALKLLGVRNSTNVAAACRGLAAMAMGDFDGKAGALTNTQILRMIELFPEMEDHTASLLGAAGFRRLCPSTSHVVAFTFLLQNAGDGVARGRVDSFVDGIHGDCRPGDPSYALRDRWMDLRLRQARGESPSRSRLLIAVVRAWNFHYAGRTTKTIITRVREGSKPPKPRGMRKRNLEAFARSLELID